MSENLNQRKTVELPKLKVLRHQVKRAYLVSNKEELHTPNNKNSPYYEWLREAIYEATKAYISHGTLNKFFNRDENLQYKIETIEVLEAYCKRHLPDYRTELLNLTENNHQKGEDDWLDAFTGNFDLFFTGGDSKIFDAVYHDDLVISSDGSLTIRNPYTKRDYVGKIFKRGSNSVQVHSYDSDFEDTFGSFISFNYNGYSPITRELYGLKMGFDANDRVCCYPVLLASKGTYSRTHPFILKYFEHYTLGRYLPLKDEDILVLKGTTY